MKIMTKKEPPRAIRLIILSLLLIWLSVPNEISVGHIVLNYISGYLCPNPTIDFCSQISFWKSFLNILGFILLIGEISYIYIQYKEGNIF